MADAELVNRWTEKVTHAKQLGLYAQSLNGGRGEVTVLAVP